MYSFGFITVNCNLLNQLLSTMTKKVCILGSGLVSSSVINFFHCNQETNFSVVVGSKESDQLKALRERYPNITTVEIDVTVDLEKLDGLIQDSDVVISLLTNEMQLPIAKKCIQLGVNMVHASYCSKEMLQLNSQAKANHVTILNEIGLDPGLDHFLAKKIIDEVRAQGDSKIKAFISYCGGLPEPALSKCNPLRYKFSWSPRTALGNMLNSAQFMDHDNVVKISAGGALIEELADFEYFPEFDLEGYPNRDSVVYKDLYGIPEVSTIIRGTLRYRGYGKCVKVFHKLGLLNSDRNNPKFKRLCDEFSNTKTKLAWDLVIKHLTNELHEPDYCDINHIDAMKERLRQNGFDKDEIEILENLGMLSTEVKLCETLLDTLAEHLLSRLSFESGERDMVVLKHLIRYEKGGIEKVHEVDFIAYGDQHIGGFSAMSKVVGLTIGNAANLLLNGVIQRPGVIYPFTADIYEPLLHQLEKEGLVPVYNHT